MQLEDLHKEWLKKQPLAPEVERRMQQQFMLDFDLKLIKGLK